MVLSSSSEKLIAQHASFIHTHTHTAHSHSLDWPCVPRADRASSTAATPHPHRMHLSTATEISSCFLHAWRRVGLNGAALSCLLSECLAWESHVGSHCHAPSHQPNAMHIDTACAARHLCVFKGCMCDAAASIGFTSAAWRGELRGPSNELSDIVDRGGQLEVFCLHAWNFSPYRYAPIGSCRYRSKCCRSREWECRSWWGRIHALVSRIRRECDTTFKRVTRVHTATQAGAVWRR
jgi:hypothetical protein